MLSLRNVSANGHYCVLFMANMPCLEHKCSHWHSCSWYNVKHSVPHFRKLNTSQDAQGSGSCETSIMNPSLKEPQSSFTCKTNVAFFESYPQSSIWCYFITFERTVAYPINNVSPLGSLWISSWATMTTILKFSWITYFPLWNVQLPWNW